MVAMVAERGPADTRNLCEECQDSAESHPRARRAYGVNR